MCIYIHMYIETLCHLLCGLNPAKEDPFESKQGSICSYIFQYWLH